jgi:hypothetical protein
LSSDRQGQAPGLALALLLPLRGWHAQQLRRLAMARHVEADALLSIDSDVVLVRPFDPPACGAMAGCACSAPTMAPVTPRRAIWPGSPMPATFSACRAIPSLRMTTFPTWSPGAWIPRARCSIIIEARSGKSWIRAVISSRDISECMIYGRFADEVLGGAGHRPDPRSLSHVLWFRETFPQTSEGLADFMRELQPDQVAIGVQSFVGHPLSEIRRLAFSVTAA